MVNHNTDCVVIGDSPGEKDVWAPSVAQQTKERRSHPVKIFQRQERTPPETPLLYCCTPKKSLWIYCAILLPNFFWNRTTSGMIFGLVSNSKRTWSMIIKQDAVHSACVHIAQTLHCFARPPWGPLSHFDVWGWWWQRFNILMAQPPDLSHWWPLRWSHAKHLKASHIEWHTPQ